LATSPNYRGLRIPKYSFGKVDSDALFGPLDQEVFDFYERNKDRYRRVLDIGANIGVHSILMARQGWEVMAFEPDPVHAKEWRANFLANHPLKVNGYSFYQKAVSNRPGRATFVRVSNNTTGSHLEGEKQSYGPVERFEVDLVDFSTPYLRHFDFAKIDCEGHEATVLECVTNKHCDYMVEVSNEVNAKRIYDHFTKLAMGMWAQKLNWAPVTKFEDVPNHHSQGHLFIGNHKP
jgi:FkbM family methyltransferase